MDLLSLHSPLTTLPSSVKSISNKSSFLSGQTILVPNIKKCPSTGNYKSLDLKAPISGSVKSTSGSNPETIKCVKEETEPKDENLVFVAGATGRVGSRTVRELLKLGFRVRAGVRSAQRAQSLAQSVQQLKLDDGASSASGLQPVERLQIVECDLERDTVVPAIGNSSVVICCIGASEKEVFDVTGPYRIDYEAAKKLIDAATVAKVNHFILLTSLGTNKIGFPAAILNLFWGVLIWKRKAEEALISSGLPFTIVRPGGMERPTDAYKETHNLVLGNEDTYFGGQVSNLQVAELMAFMAQNRSLSYCKVVEVIAETTAPLTPMGELLSKIPSQRVDPFSIKETKVDIKPEVTPKSVASEATRTIEKEAIQTEVPKKLRPLSPYTAYEDLKPPTSPAPTPSTTPGGSKESHINVMKAEPKSVPQDTQIDVSVPPISSTKKEVDQTEVPKQRPLSPFFFYEDLKPPASPTPTQSSSNDHKGVTNAAPTSTSNSSPLSPYPAYEDLKPPTLPTPMESPSNGREVETVTQPPSASSPKEVPLVTNSNSRPLSPYTAYEDLKPPSSPRPSSP